MMKDKCNREIKSLENESYNAYQFLHNFCLDYCKDEDSKQEFLDNLNNYLEAEIELEKCCGR